MPKAKEKFPAPAKDASKSEKRKHMRKVQDYARKVMFEEVFGKYIPLLEKTFEEAKGMKVPEALEERKKDIIGEQEERFNQLKQAVEKFQADKKSKDKEQGLP